MFFYFRSLPTRPKDRYLGERNHRGISDEWNKFSFQGNTIIIRYGQYGSYNKFNAIGEFRFKWDEKAQWFGVEQVIYNQTATKPKTTQENKPVTNQSMQFSQPVQIGRIYFPLGNTNMKIKIENATYTGSKSDGTFQGDVGYPYDRLTKFGNVGNDIYIHHKYRYGFEINSKANFGDKDIKNTIELKVNNEVRFFQLKSNSSIKFYILKLSEGAPSNVALIGKKDGKWIKYFETFDILKRYFGDNYYFDSWAGIVVGQKSEVKFGNRFKHGLYCENDTIIIEYEKNNGGKGPIFGKDTNEYGEFRLKWDEKAQWFGIEKVVY